MVADSFVLVSAEQALEIGRFAAAQYRAAVIVA